MHNRRRTGKRRTGHGAAILLDSPGYGFVCRHLTASRNSWYPERDTEELSRLLHQFETKCRNQCRAMAAKATELEPGNACWWRLRALLLWGSNSCSDEYKVRTEDWLELVERCKAHDFNNALYDYLAALHLLNESVEDYYSDGKSHFKITNSQEYDQALQYLQRAQKLSKCLIDDDGTPALFAFLKRTSISSFDRASIANKANNIKAPVEDMLIDLLQHQSLQIDEAEQSGDVTDLLLLHLEQRLMLNQFCHPDSIMYLGWFRWVDLRETLKNCQDFAEFHPELVRADLLAEIEADYKKAEIDEKVFWAADRRIPHMKERPATASNPLTQSFDSFEALSSSFSNIVLLTLSPLLIIGFGSCLAGNVIGGAGPKSPGILGIIRHAICWLAGFGLTFVVLGITMRGIPPETQRWIIVALFILPLFAVFYWSFWIFIKNRNAQYGLYVLVIFLILIVVGQRLFLFTSDDPNNIKRLYLPARVPPASWRGMNPYVLQDILGPHSGYWNLALWQWLAYMGPYISIGIASILVICWYNIRYKRIAPETGSQMQSRWAGMFVCLGRSMLFCACLVIMGCLLIVPSFIGLAEENYRDDMAYIRNPHQYQDSMKAAMAEVRANKDFMAALENELRNAPATQPATTP